MHPLQNGLTVTYRADQTYGDWGNPLSLLVDAESLGNVIRFHATMYNGANAYTYAPTIGLQLVDVFEVWRARKHTMSECVDIANRHPASNTI